jgi:6,7-dimethyl-8-ribityllumazine synthase
VSDEREDRDGSGDELERAAENVLEGWPAPTLDDPPEDPPFHASQDPPETREAPIERTTGWSTAAELPVDDRRGADEVVELEPELEPAVDELPEELGDVSPPEVVASTEIASDERGLAPEAPPTAIPAAEPRAHVSSEHAPGELAVPPGIPVLEGEVRGERRAVGIVVSRFNGEVTSRLLEHAIAELEARGVASTSITVMPVPGAFELPLAAMALAKTRRFACIVALGCVIRGDTPHFDYVASEAASGLQLAAIETGVPVSFGVLTLDRHDQAEARYDKGAEAVRTALEMADLFANLRAAASR